MRKNIKIKTRPFKVYSHGFDWSADIVMASSHEHAIEIWFKDHPWLKVSIARYITRADDPVGTRMAIIQKYFANSEDYHCEWYFARDLAYEEGSKG